MLACFLTRVKFWRASYHKLGWYFFIIGVHAEKDVRYLFSLPKEEGSMT